MEWKILKSSDLHDQRLIQSGEPGIVDSCCVFDQDGVFPSASQLKLAVAALLLYFGVRLLFLALTISPFVPPDEVSHFGICRVFSTVLFLPENSSDSYQYGLVTNIPWLYYWIMGKLLLLNISGIPDLIYLRLLNIPFAFATVYYVWRTLRLLTDDRLTQILLIVAMTNTIMFTFLSASVSYDNLTNLLAAMAIYYLLAFFKEGEENSLVLSFFCQLCGALVKSSFLPLLAILNIILLVHSFRNLRHLPHAVRSYFHSNGVRSAVLIAGILVTFGFNIHLYGGNYLKYGKLVPQMFDIVSFENTMENRLAARDLIFDLFREGRVSREEALAMTARITHPGDRNFARQLIENHHAEKTGTGTPLIGPLNYVPMWCHVMLAGVFGIYGHLMMPNRGVGLLPFIILMIISGVGFFVAIKAKVDRLFLRMASICAFYGIILLYFVNYEAYLYYRTPVAGLQGRYIFPLLGLIYVLSAYSLLNLWKSHIVRLSVTIVTIIIFIAGDFPYFIMHLGPGWLNSP